MGGGAYRSFYWRQLEAQFKQRADQAVQKPDWVGPEGERWVAQGSLVNPWRDPCARVLSLGN